MWEIESTGYMTPESRWYKLLGRNINRDIDNCRPVIFRNTKTQEKRKYVPYYTCCNTSHGTVFTCSGCGAVIVGNMLDDFDCSVSYTDAASFCANCGARIIRDATYLELRNESL